MAELLTAFMAANGSEPWQPGKVDCCMVLADWAIWLGHRDPAEHLRGRYEDETGFREIVSAAGSVSALVGHCAAKIAGTRVTEPVCGAVGVVGSASNINRQFGAIFDGKRWMWRNIKGWQPMTAPVLDAWVI